MLKILSMRMVLDLLNDTLGADCLMKEDTCELSCGSLKFALEIRGQVFLVWQDADEGIRLISKLEEWDFESIADDLSNIPWIQFQLPMERFFVFQDAALH